jgi:two-component system C4-dicarboxylate transport response regulator DctD
MRRLMAHTWPGNVRELRNVADCIVLGVGKDILGTAATSDAPPASLAESVESFERSLIAAELRRQGGSLARSAEALRIAKTTLHDKIKKYGLQGGEA